MSKVLLPMYIEILTKYLTDNTYDYQINNISIDNEDDFIIANVSEFAPFAPSESACVPLVYDLTVLVDGDSYVSIRNDGGRNCISIESYMESTCESRENAEKMYAKYVEIVKKYKCK